VGEYIVYQPLVVFGISEVIIGANFASREYFIIILIIMDEVESHETKDVSFVPSTQEAILGYT
jgi:hypothetical protein